MNCFPCFGNKNDDDDNNNDNKKNEEVPVAQVKDPAILAPPVYNTQKPPEEANHCKNETTENGNNGARTFTFRELAMATKNFRQEFLLGEGGFGKLYKGSLQTGEVVAVKRLDRNGTQGTKEFQVEVLMLTLLHHPNLVSLLGYCADGEQRLLVYEYLPFGSLEPHVHDLSADKKQLDWQTRMKIANGIAQGLQYLHEKANPSIVYRDLKMSNILLDEDFNPKLSDYGLAKLTQQGDTKMHITPRVMGNNGYCAPEYESHGELTIKSDIYSFGVVLLELITGHRALDTARPADEQNLVAWAQPFFKDPKRFPEMADPLLKKEFPERHLNQVVGIAAMCLQEEPSVRPLIGDVLEILGFLAVAPPEETLASTQSAAKPPSKVKSSGKHEDCTNNSDSSDHEDEESEDEYTSNSEYGYSGSSDGSDHENGGNAANGDEGGQNLLHKKSKKVSKKISSSKHKDKEMGKRESKKTTKKSSRSSSSRKIKKVEDDEGRLSYTSSSSGSAHQSPRSSHHESVNLRHNSIGESQDNEIGSSLGRARYEESFSWSIGSSSKFKSRNGSRHVDSESKNNIELHNSSLHASMRRQNSHSGSEYSPSDDED